MWLCHGATCMDRNLVVCRPQPSPRSLLCFVYENPYMHWKYVFLPPRRSCLYSRACDRSARRSKRSKWPGQFCPCPAATIMDGLRSRLPRLYTTSPGWASMAHPPQLNPILKHGPNQAPWPLIRRDNRQGSRSLVHTRETTILVMSLTTDDNPHPTWRHHVISHIRH